MMADIRRVPGANPRPEALSETNEFRVLILAPTSNDARLTSHFLQQNGFASTICASLVDVGSHMGAGCGALLLAEEALVGTDMDALVEELKRQPSWSDLPLILITGPGNGVEVRPRYLTALAPVGNITIIERPVRPETLVSTCEVALRSRRRQYQVRDLLVELDKADRRKDEFLAMLAHELRNPLAAVVNAVSLLTAASESDREWATAVIARQSGQLAHLIDDLLDVSRITTGKIRLRRQIVDAADVLDRARDAVAPLINARNHNLLCNYTGGSLWVDADPTRLEQIVLNLLTNAAKYTPAGGQIKLSGTVCGTEVVIAVCDNGIGIAPERIPELFHLFAQGERSIARSEGGLGIGLTIVQKLVEMHGGRIEAESGGLNLGATFKVRFALAHKTAAANGATKNGVSPLFRRRVLIVDDNVDTAQGLSRLLRRAGHDIALAHDGTQALARAQEQTPEAVLLDIGLPGMDGFEVVKLLRQQSSCAEAMIIAVTGYGQPEDRQRVIEAGFDHHLVKPVDIGELNVLLQRGKAASTEPNLVP
jgi:signal transduction histidine kinase/ActR/RegA family two-component response regulator